MAVLIEAISVVVRMDAIRRVFGEWGAFTAVVPNNTLCYDDELVRIGFMAEVDAEAFLEVLKGRGLSASVQGSETDMVLVDQLRGVMSPCEWLDVVKVDIGPDRRVSAALLSGSTSDMLSCPSSWSYERSLTSKYGHAFPSENGNGLRFSRHENGLDVYWNNLTGEEVFCGRSVA